MPHRILFADILAKQLNSISGKYNQQLNLNNKHHLIITI